ncbi:hypothetical protein NHQ30_001108 [Ciborinia camelliae]|nr:hypothetical protein NHQ30_001108 [Ciborinia camelliae]
MSSQGFHVLTEGRKRQAEQQKVAVQQGRWKALQGAGIHVLPIIITVVLLFLNTYRVYANSIGSADAELNTRLNGLQFVAKVHEILIGVSLSTIVLSFVQQDILRRGIPLGAFFIAFRITDLGSLLNPELWAAGAIGNDFKRRSLFVAMSILIMILAAICGPASAILMRPSLDWWDVPTTKYSSWSTDHFTLQANASQVWPKQIDNSSFDSSCASESGKFSDNCAAGGFSTIQAWADRPSSLRRSSLETESLWNITMPMSSKDVFYDRFIVGGGFNSRKPSKVANYNDEYVYTGYLSQTMSVPAGSLITSIAQMIESHNETPRFRLLINGEDPPAPQTFATCINEYYSITAGAIDGYKSLDDVLLPFIRKNMTYGRYGRTESQQAFNLWNSSGRWPLAMWMQPPNEGTDSPSIGVVMFNGYQKGQGNNATTAPGQDSWYFWVSSCSLFSGWQSSELFIDPTRDRYIHSPSITYLNKSIDDWWMKNSSESRNTMRMVRVDTEWANVALPPNDTILALASSPVGITHDFPLAMAATTLISDAMARVPYMMNFGFKVSTPTVLRNQNFTTLSDLPDDVADIRVKRYRYGYSYSLRGSTRRLAVAILVLHSIVALIHAILVFRHGYTCNMMNSLTEILALAINSPPSAALDNTCAGIERLDTYKNMIRVREVSSAHLGLVVGNDGDIVTKKVVAGKKYGSLKDESYYCKED